MKILHKVLQTCGGPVGIFIDEYHLRDGLSTRNPVQPCAETSKLNKARRRQVCYICWVCGRRAFAVNGPSVAVRYVCLPAERGFEGKW